MEQVLIGLIATVGIFLTLVILAQNSKGGMGSAFGGASSHLMGAKRTTDFFEKLTWGFVAFVLVASLLVNVLIKSTAPTQTGYQSPNIEAAKDKNVVTPTVGTDAQQQNTQVQGQQGTQTPPAQGTQTTQSTGTQETPVQK